MNRSTTTKFDAWLPWLLPVALLVLWQVSVARGWIANRYLPTPTAVLAAAQRLIANGELFRYLGVSTGRALAGLLVGGSLGFGLGLLNGLLPKAERTLDTSVQMLRNIPHLALIPLVIL